MWWFNYTPHIKSEEDQLKDRILVLIEKNIRTYKFEYSIFEWGNGNIELWEWFSLYISTISSIQENEKELLIKYFGDLSDGEYCLYNWKLYFNWETIFSHELDNNFFNKIINLFKSLKTTLEKERQERLKIKQKLAITEALSYLISKELTNISKEVKDEFNPIFTKVKRVVEITKELEDIRKEFSIT